MENNLDNKALDNTTAEKTNTDAKNLLKMQFAYRKEGISNVSLPSVFIHRTDYGDLRADFKPILDNILDQTFSTDDSMIVGEDRYGLIDEKLELDDSELTAPIIADAIIENLDSYEVSEYETLKVNMDAANIERIFNTVLKGFTGQFKNWARTKSVVCGTLYGWFHKANIDIEQVQKLLEMKEADVITYIKAGSLKNIQYIPEFRAICKEVYRTQITEAQAPNYSVVNPIGYVHVNENKEQLKLRKVKYLKARVMIKNS